MEALKLLNSTFERKRNQYNIEGLFALKDYKKGDFLFFEKPLFTVVIDDLMKRDSSASKIEGYETEEDVQKEMNKLNDQERKCFLELHDSFARGDQEKTLLGIYRTNSRVVHKRFHNFESGIFALYSRMNHSCVCNVHTAYCEAEGGIFVTVGLDIKQGEELTVDYVADFLPRKERMEKLMNLYRFSCKCPCCSLTGAAQKKSDERRILLKQLDEILVPQCMYSQQFRRAIAFVEKIIDLLKKEKCDIPALLSRAYGDQYQAELQLNERKKAIETLKIALRYRIMAETIKGDAAQSLNPLLFIALIATVLVVTAFADQNTVRDTSDRFLENVKRRWARLTPEQRDAIRQRFVKVYATLPEETQQKIKLWQKIYTSKSANEDLEVYDPEIVCGGFCIGAALLGTAVASGFAYKRGYKNAPTVDHHHYHRDDDEIWPLLSKAATSFKTAREITSGVLTRGPPRKEEHHHVYDLDEDEFSLQQHSKWWNGLSEEKQNALAATVALKLHDRPQLLRRYLKTVETLSAQPQEDEDTFVCGGACILIGAAALAGVISGSHIAGQNNGRTDRHIHHYPKRD